MGQDGAGLWESCEGGGEKRVRNVKFFNEL